MKKLIAATFFLLGINTVSAGSNMQTFSNPQLAEVFSAVESDYNTDGETWDVTALRTVLQDSNLYKILLPLNVTLPNMVKTGQYVIMLNEVHQINHNLELILQELQKINEKL